MTYRPLERNFKSNRNIIRLKALEEFGQGKGTELFYLDEAYVFMNSYKTAKGNTHKLVCMDKHALVSLLRRSSSFERLATKQYKYINKQDVK